LVIALAFHGWLASGTDLRGIPGACAQPMVHSLSVDDWSRSELYVHLMRWCLPLFGGDALITTRVATILCGLCAVLGAMFAASSLLGWRAAVGAGLVAAIWSQSAFLWLLIGADTMAWGLSWLGLGVAWICARRGPLGALGVLLGTALVLLSAAIKIMALPAAAFLFVAPLLVDSHRRRYRAAVTCSLLVVFGIAYLAFRPQLSGGFVDAPSALSPSLLLTGTASFMSFLLNQPEGWMYAVLGGLAASGALLPASGPSRGRWSQRGVLAILGFVVVAVTCESLGDKIRSRFLVVTAFPIIVLAGCAFVLVQHAVERAISHHLPRWSKMVGWLVPCAIVPFLVLDCLAFMHAWSRLRETAEGANASTLPRPPEALANHYLGLSESHVLDISGIGGIDMAALGASAPEAGVLIPPLRDETEFILLAHAAHAGKINVQLRPELCCGYLTQLDSCAVDLVSQVDRAGARLVLPNLEDQETVLDRVDPKFGEWTALLIDAAGDSLVREGRWWLVMDGSGADGPTPCATRQMWKQGSLSKAPATENGPDPAAMSGIEPQPTLGPDP